MQLELIHPMLVHFPIALLSTGVLVRFAALWNEKKTAFSFLLPASWMILFLGIIAAGAAAIAGEIAREIVEPTLQNTDVLNEHIEHAYLTATGFTLGLLIDWTRAFLLSKSPKKRWFVQRGLGTIVWFFYLISLINLLVTGFYGATLVYEQGAAVHKSEQTR